jgi:HsdM-like protein
VARPRKATTKPAKSLEQTLWDAADKMRGNLEAAEYKHIALGLVFLKYVSDSFEQRRRFLEAADRHRRVRCRSATGTWLSATAPGCLGASQPRRTGDDEGDSGAGQHDEGRAHGDEGVALDPSAASSRPAHSRPAPPDLSGKTVGAPRRPTAVTAPGRCPWL